MKRLQIGSLFVLLFTSLILAACGTPTATPTAAPAATAIPPTEVPAPKDIVDTAVADGRFTTLVAAVQAAGLVDTLKGEGPFTVFAPTDDAFAKLPAGTVEELLKPENLETLKNTLLYHVVSGKVMAADVVTLDGKTADTAFAGNSVAISVKDGNVFLNENVQVIITDIETANGVIHVIDTVLLPPAKLADIVDTAVADGRFTTLVAAVQAAGLAETLKGEGPFTVFAPTDEAFAKLPAGTVENLLKPENLETLKNTLLYHVVSGKVMAADVVTLDGKTADTAFAGNSVAISVKDGKVFLNETVQVVITDIETTNGVIHVIDTVLLPPAKLADIVDTAVADGRFTTLVAAVQAAGLVDTLKGEGPFTLFAPTDDAFAKLPAGTVENLLKPENLETLKNILLYHVVSGKVMAADVVTLDGKTADTAFAGNSVTISVKDGKVFLNETVQVIITDIETTNGVIHVIDTVLLPE
ncbi:MAG: fasciclin domain-containing protein [Chloroflexota bacterium]